MIEPCHEDIAPCGTWGQHSELSARRTKFLLQTKGYSPVVREGYPVLIINAELPASGPTLTTDDIEIARKFSQGTVGPQANLILLNISVARLAGQSYFKYEISLAREGKSCFPVSRFLAGRHFPILRKFDPPHRS
jgi:hypothetical protein